MSFDIKNAVTRASLKDTYNRSGHALDGCPFAVLQEISSLAGYHYYVNDFVTYEGPIADGATKLGGWVVTSVDGGADTAEEVVVQDSSQFGVLKITTNDADDDNTQIQLAGSSFRYVVGKRLWCFARLAIEDADDGEMGFGLVKEDATDMVNTAPTDGIYFEKAETATTLDFHTRKNDVDSETAGASGTLSDATYIIVGFKVNTDGSVSAYSGTTLDNLALEATVVAGSTSLPDDEDLTLAFQVQTGSAATRYMLIDWVFVAQER